MPTGRYGLSCGVVGGGMQGDCAAAEVVVVGGQGEDGILDKVEIFSVSDQQWRFGSSCHAWRDQTELQFCYLQEIPFCSQIAKRRSFPLGAHFSLLAEQPGTFERWTRSTSTNQNAILGLLCLDRG
jgi:hypothetical protein